MSSNLVRKWLEESGATLIKPSGHNLISTCPFHDDHKRSFSIDSTNGRYICFSAWCGNSGGPIRFLMEGCGKTFEEAREEAKDLEDGLGVEEQDGWAVIPDRGKIEVEDPVVTEAELGLYDFCPRYMLWRGFSKSVLKKWEVGYDRESKKVTFPVRDKHGDLVGLSLRKTEGEGPKYLHLHFKRREHLYGLYAADKSKELWVGEGQTDALALSQIGLNAVSTMGSRVSPIHTSLLGHWPAPVVLAFDDDEDGWVATVRTGEGLLEMGNKDVFVACRWPADVKDPGDLLLSPLSAVFTFKTSLVPYALWRLRKDRVSLVSVVEEKTGDRWRSTRPKYK